MSVAHPDLERLRRHRLAHGRTMSRQRRLALDQLAAPRPEWRRCSTPSTTKSKSRVTRSVSLRRGAPPSAPRTRGPRAPGRAPFDELRVVGRRRPARKAVDVDERLVFAAAFDARLHVELERSHYEGSLARGRATSADIAQPVEELEAHAARASAPRTAARTRRRPCRRSCARTASRDR